MSDKGLISKNILNLYNSMSKKQTTRSQKWAEELNRNFSREDIQIANRHMKKCSISLFIAAAAAKSLQSCPTLCEPIDGNLPGSPSLGFSRQEHWSGLPFPSPMHESEKWKWSRPVVSDSSRSHGLQPTRLLCPWDFPGKSTGVGCHSLFNREMQIKTTMRYHLIFATVAVIKNTTTNVCQGSREQEF